MQRAIAVTADSLYQLLEPGRIVSAWPQEAIPAASTRVDEDAARPTRRRVALPGVKGRAARVSSRSGRLVKRLADSRLVVTTYNERTGQEEVEVAHEALLSHWPLLGEWLTRFRAAIRLRDGVSRAAREWDDSGRADAFLVYQGARLREVRTLEQGSQVNLSELEQDYLSACHEWGRDKAGFYDCEIRIFHPRDGRHPLRTSTSRI